jgi:hypothetical protein
VGHRGAEYTDLQVRRVAGDDARPATATARPAKAPLSRISPKGVVVAGSRSDNGAMLAAGPDGHVREPSFPD